MDEVKSERIVTDSIVLEELDQQNLHEFSRILKRFVCALEKRENAEDSTWLKEQIQQELPNLTEAERAEMAQEAISTVELYDKELSELNADCSKGMSKESWFAKKSEEAAAGIAVAQYGEWLQLIDSSISAAISRMREVVTTDSGEISQCLNLDGFIAEQHHVNSFNLNATLKGAPFYAEVCVPQEGKPYGKNSFDLVIKDKSAGRIVHQYQVKYGADAGTTVELLRRGNYSNQIIVVPPEQLAYVQKAFPGKTVVASIGGTDAVPTKSIPLTKFEAKDRQICVQEQGEIPALGWNAYSAKQLTCQLGKNAAIAGIQAATISTGFNLVLHYVQQQSLDCDETVESALRTGADAGLKSAVAGAVKVASEKGVLTVIPHGTPVGIIANITCVAIENIKILAKTAAGEISTTDALEHMGRTSVVMYSGLTFSMAVGAAALSWIPFVSPIVSGVVGGMLGYMAGAGIGEAAFSGFKKITSSAGRVVKSFGNALKNTAKKVGRKIFS